MTSIWKKKATPETINQFNAGCLVAHLNITVVEMGADYLKATMPVDHRTRQPFGVLHGGASVVLAESLGSIASYLALDDAHYGVGLEINANHLKSVRGGTVIGTVKPIHLGRSTHVWEITIQNEEDTLICVSRLTMAVLKINEPEDKISIGK